MRILVVGAGAIGSLFAGMLTAGGHDVWLLGRRREAVDTINREGLTIQQISKGEKVEVNDEKSYNNGVKVVPSFLLEPEVVTKDTVKSKLIDSGFLKASDVGL